MKRFFSFLMIFSIVLSCFMVGAFSASAAETGKIYFQVPDSWGATSQVYCHIWEKDGESFFGWQSKKERCEDMGDGLWAFDLSNLSDDTATVKGGFSASTVYAVIFSSEAGWQTYDLNLIAACIGDTAECDGETVSNPVDSSKSAYIARWKENGDTVHPVVQHNSTGTLIDPDKVGENGQVPKLEQTDISNESVPTGNDAAVLLCFSALIIVLGLTAIVSSRKRKA